MTMSVGEHNTSSSNARRIERCVALQNKMRRTVTERTKMLEGRRSVSTQYLSIFYSCLPIGYVARREYKCMFGLLPLQRR